MAASKTLERIGAARLIAVIRADSSDEAVRAAGALIEGGVTVVELTFTTPGVVKESNWSEITRRARRFADAVDAVHSAIPAPAGSRGPSAQVGCSFCGKSREQVNRLVPGPGGVHICSECIEMCQEVIEEGSEG